MGITINQPFPFPNLPPQSNVYAALGTAGIYMTMKFDDTKTRSYSIDMISKYWLSKETYEKGLEPVFIQTGTIEGNIQQMANINAFFHDSLASALIEKGISDITIDYISN